MRELARSRNYVVIHDYEDASIVLSDGRRVAAGSFYGDPTSALIDSRERWCVIAGCRLLVYFLREPYFPVDIYPTWQYAWIHPPWDGDTWWIEAVVQLSDDAVRIVVDPASSSAGIYELQFPELNVTKSR